MKDNWISVGHDLPAYGEPLLITVGNTVQNITYCFDAADDQSAAWFEPYHFDHDDELKIPAHKITSWQYIPEPPK